MVALNVFFSLLAFAVLVLLIVGFFSPKSSLFWMKVLNGNIEYIGMKKFLLLICTLGMTACTGDSNKYIAGLSPNVVYSNLTDIGFSNDREFNEYGKMWTCSKADDGLKCKVVIFSPEAVDKVQSVTATIMVDPLSGKEVKSGLNYLQFVASIPYTMSDPDKAASWVSENIDSNDATTTIGDVKFTISAPSDFVRILGIEQTDSIQ